MKMPSMKEVVGAGLLLFVFIVGSIILHGLLNTKDGISVVMFKTIYFAFTLIILGIVYISARGLLNSKMEHAIIIVAIIVFSAGIAAASGSAKHLQDNALLSGSAEEVNAMQAQNAQYLLYVKSMTEFSNSIKADNRILEEKIGTLTEKINNRTPVVVETVITIPGEIIYEEVPVVQPVQQPVVPRYEREEEDD